jgi:hypothetical protein
MGGPDIDNILGLTSKRRSVYLRIAAEKEVEFLKIFDSPSVTECYERRPSVMPQQALALSNSDLALAQARLAARSLSITAGDGGKTFVDQAFLTILARRPRAEEVRLCCQFLDDQTRRLQQKGNSVLEGEEKVPAESGSTSSGLHTPPQISPVQRARENLVLVLFNHTEFVTIR